MAVLQVSRITSKHAIVADGVHVVNSVGMAFRYIAGYDPASKQPSNLTAIMVNANGTVVATLYRSPPLDKYQYRPFTTYSPPVVVNAAGLQLKFPAGTQRCTATSTCSPFIRSHHRFVEPSIQKALFVPQ